MDVKNILIEERIKLLNHWNAVPINRYTKPCKVLHKYSGDAYWLYATYSYCGDRRVRMRAYCNGRAVGPSLTDRAAHYVYASNGQPVASV